MVEGVVLDLCEPFAKKGHELKKREINAVGTILKTRVGQPVMTVNEPNLPQDEFVAKFCYWRLRRYHGRCRHGEPAAFLRQE
jgi:hypothetical protein